VGPSQRTDQARRPDTSARIFVSYSRSDIAFVDRLETALKSRGFATLIDRSDIFAFEDWWKRIEALIAAADTVVFVISPGSIASDICRREVRFAAALNKRFAPIVYRSVDLTTIPLELSRLNLIFFDDDSRFDENANRLAGALSTNIDWIRKHTEFGERAERWHLAGRPEPHGLMLRPPLLDEGERWITARPPTAPEPTEATRSFIATSRRVFDREMKRTRRIKLAIYSLSISVIIGVAGWANEERIMAFKRAWTITDPFMRLRVRPFVLTAATEQTLRAGQTFRECAVERETDDCPEMVVLPVGSFMMGASSDAAPGVSELPRHRVVIAKPFAASKFEITFDEWDTCVETGDCDPRISDSGRGRGSRPVINVSWYDAQTYVEWLSKMTGRTYRLLTESEYEYAARGGTRTIYPWGEDVGHGNANCDGCGSKWDNLETAPVGSFAPNRFGLYDMVGNVWKWVEDCFHDDYDNAPDDGSAWLKGGNCDSRVVRGGSWGLAPTTVRSSNRDANIAVGRSYSLSFRVARTIEQ